jgi:hypothetical protein
MLPFALSPGTRCPRCGGKIDNAVGPGQPKRGDVVICHHCAGALVVTNIATLREFRDDEFRRLSPAQMLMIGEMQRRIIAKEPLDALVGDDTR